MKVRYHTKTKGSDLLWNAVIVSMRRFADINKRLSAMHLIRASLKGRELVRRINYPHLDFLLRLAYVKQGTHVFHVHPTRDNSRD